MTRLTPDEQQLVDEILAAANGDPQKIASEISLRTPYPLGCYSVPELRLALQKCPSPVDLSAVSTDEILMAITRPGSVEKLKDVPEDVLNRYADEHIFNALPASPPEEAPRPFAPVPPPADSGDRAPAPGSTHTGELRFPEPSGTAPEPPAARTRQQPTTERDNQRSPGFAWMSLLYVPVFCFIAVILWMMVAHWTHVSTAIGDATGQPFLGGLFTFTIAVIAIVFSAIGAIKLAMSRKRRNSKRRTGAMKRRLRSFLDD